MILTAASAGSIIQSSNLSAEVSGCFLRLTCVFSALYMRCFQRLLSTVYCFNVRLCSNDVAVVETNKVVCRRKDCRPTHLRFLTGVLAENQSLYSD